MKNCSDTHPLYLRFYLPEDVVAINNIALNFKTQRFRAQSTATEVNTENSTVSSSGSSGSSVTPTYGSWTTACSITIPNLDCEGTYISAIADSIGSATGSNGTYGLKLRIYDGTEYYPSSMGQHIIIAVFGTIVPQ